MAVSGLELYKIFQQSVGKAYTSFTTKAVFNRWAKSSYPKVVNDIYSERLNNQRAFDEVGYLISLNTVFNVNQIDNTIAYSSLPLFALTYVGTTVTASTEVPHGLQSGDSFTISDTQGVANVNGITLTVANVLTVTTFNAIYPIAPTGVYVANTGVVTPANAVADYMHYLYGEATFVEPYYDLKIVNATNATPILISVDKRNKIRNKDKIVVSGINGNTAANGEFYIKWLNEKLFGLYTDINLQTPVSGNGNYTGGGTIELVKEVKGLKMWLSDQKGALYGQPSTLEAYFQQGKLQMEIYPKNIPCRSVKVDYIRRMPVEINANDNVYDYERDYPYTFLEKIAIEAARQFSVAVRDGSLQAGLTEEILENN